MHLYGIIVQLGPRPRLKLYVRPKNEHESAFEHHYHHPTTTANRVRKGILPKVFGCPHQLLQNMVIDPSTPTLRKVEDGEKKKIMAELVATNVVASRSPERRPTGILITCAKNGGGKRIITGIEARDRLNSDQLQPRTLVPIIQGGGAKEIRSDWKLSPNIMIFFVTPTFGASFSRLKFSGR